MEVHLWVDSKAAMKAGTLRYGWMPFTITEEILGQLSEQDREQLAELLGESGDRWRLGCDGQGGPASWLPKIGLPNLSGFRAVVSEAQRIKARKRADQIEAEVRRVLAEGEEGITWRREGDRSTFSIYASEETVRHPAVVELIDRSRKRFEDRLARGPQTSAKLREWGARHVPELSRAAAEGYAIEENVVSAIAESIATNVDAELTLVEGTEDYRNANWEERRAPRNAAFEVRDRIATLLDRVEKPACLEIELSRIVRFNSPFERYGNGFAEYEKKPSRYTAVLIFIRSPVTKERIVVVDAEGSTDRGREEAV